MRDARSRQSFLGANSDELLDAACVAIIGLGGGGSHVAQQLAHVGIGNWILSDHDAVEASNLNRLVGATVADAMSRTPKVVVAERVIRGLNPGAHVTAHQARWQDDHLLLREADIIVGAVDSFRERFELESCARRTLTPYIDLGMDVYSKESGFGIAGQVALCMPGYACLKCMGIVTDDRMAVERYGVAGGRPQVVWSNGLIASMAVGIIVNLLTPWHEAQPHSMLFRYDGNRQVLEEDGFLASHPGMACSHYPIADCGDPFFTLDDSTLPTHTTKQSGWRGWLRDFARRLRMS